MTNPFQFSIRGVMFVTAAVGVAFAVLERPPSVTQSIATEMLAVLFFSLSFITAHEATGAHRRFWTGFAISTAFGAALSTAALPCVLLVTADDGSRPAVAANIADLSKILLPTFWLFAPVNGFLCLAIRWFVRSR
jgi:hypothetical protein